MDRRQLILPPWLACLTTTLQSFIEQHQDLSQHTYGLCQYLVKQQIKTAAIQSMNATRLCDSRLYIESRIG